MQFPLALFPLLAAFAAAAPAASTLEERAATTCGSTSYSAAQVSAASQQACSYYKDGKKAGSYPHTYNNYEGFNFRVAGPYQEFPIKSSGVYTGGEYYLLFFRARALVWRIAELTCALILRREPRC